MLSHRPDSAQAWSQPVLSTLSINQIATGDHPVKLLITRMQHRMLVDLKGVDFCHPKMCQMANNRP